MILKSCETILREFLPSVSRSSCLVPELTLSILTSSNPLWNIPYEEAMRKLDRTDPWWAFFWPGSQAVSRFVFDNKNLFKEKRVLDLGCGCGANAIAAKLVGASIVIANDIDRDALIATKHNAKLNNVFIDEFSLENLLENPSNSLKKFQIDWLIIGDMCYEENLSRSIVDLIRTARKCHIEILLGDPGRFAFETFVRRQLIDVLKKVAEFPIVDRDSIENDFQTIQIWRS